MIYRNEAYQLKRIHNLFEYENMVLTAYENMEKLEPNTIANMIYLLCKTNPNLESSNHDSTSRITPVSLVLKNKDIFHDTLDEGVYIMTENGKKQLEEFKDANPKLYESMKGVICDCKLYTNINQESIANVADLYHSMLVDTIPKRVDDLIGPDSDRKDEVEALLNYFIDKTDSLKLNLVNTNTHVEILNILKNQSFNNFLNITSLVDLTDKDISKKLDINSLRYFALFIVEKTYLDLNWKSHRINLYRFFGKKMMILLL